MFYCMCAVFINLVKFRNQFFRFLQSIVFNSIHDFLKPLKI